MKLRIVLVSENKQRLKDKNLEVLIDEYIKRTRLFAEATFEHIKPSGKLSIVGDIKSKYKQAHIILLDEHGKKYTSEKFAEKIDTIHTYQSSEIVFVVGDTDGFSKEDLKEATETFSLSELTFHHELAVLVLAEQLYRALSILNNHPYHRE